MSDDSTPINPTLQTESTLPIDSMDEANKIEQASNNSPDIGGATASITTSSTLAPTILVLGMAGAGKTTFVQTLTARLHSKGTPPYVINLDPAVLKVPYPVNIDIRDTVNYKEVMKQYNLGPNGGIMTALNLFATQFDQVLDLIQQRAKEHPLIILDTPGQLEVFTWSASGTIISETLASVVPTIVVYIMDTSRSVNPTTFMSNMLYACSVLYKTTLPFILVMNKCDIIDNGFAIEWMKDFTVFHQALAQETSYMSNLVQSMSLALEEFYQTITCVGVSSLTGAGMDEFLVAVQKSMPEYEDYKKRIAKFKLKKEQEKEVKEQKRLEKISKKSGKGEKIELTLTSNSANYLGSDSEDELYNIGVDSDSDTPPETLDDDMEQQ